MIPGNRVAYIGQALSLDGVGGEVINHLEGGWVAVRWDDQPDGIGIVAARNLRVVNPLDTEFYTPKREAADPEQPRTNTLASYDLPDCATGDAPCECGPELADWEKELVAAFAAPAKADQFTADVAALFQQAQDTLLSKHRDYGPKNISQSPGGPLNGLRVRMWDKTARLNNLLDNNQDPQHESVEDTLLDLANYALIGVLVLRGQWPQE